MCFPLPLWLRHCLRLVLPLPLWLRHYLRLVLPLPLWLRHCLCLVLPLPSRLTHCLCLMSSLPSWLKQCLLSLLCLRSIRRDLQPRAQLDRDPPGSRELQATGVVRYSNSGHSLLLPPANRCPMFASRTTQGLLSLAGIYHTRGDGTPQHCLSLVFSPPFFAETAPFALWLLLLPAQVRRRGTSSSTRLASGC